MTLTEAQQNADQVLDAERSQPTVIYMSPGPFVNAAAMFASALGQRGQHPRPVSQQPGFYQLQSRNYELLKAFLEALTAEQRPPFFAGLRDRIGQPGAFVVVEGEVLGSGRTDRTNSELPLVAEFLVREGEARSLLRGLRDAPLRPGVTRLLLHIEEMIALDFRLFSNAEYDELKLIVSETNRRISQVNRQERLRDTLESNFRFYVCQEGPALCDSITKQCERAKYLRLSAKVTLENTGRLEGLDALKPNSDDENFGVLAKQVRSAIENGTPETGLDRLHTFALKYIRTIYERHFGRVPERDTPANSLLGEFANDLRDKGLIRSKMAAEILKSSARVLEQFNYVRNNQSLAHVNPELISREEAYFMYQSVAASIRFLQSFDKKG